MQIRRRPLLFASLAGLAFEAHAQSVRKVSWADLLPKGKRFDDGISKLGPQDQLELIEIAALRDRRARGVTMTREDLSHERHALAHLKKKGIDADSLLKHRKDTAAKRLAYDTATNAEVVNQQVRMAGYMIPLTLDKKMQAVDFLLVPTAVACIHELSPPPNQVVHVTPSKPVDAKPLQAVMITGRLSAEATRKTVVLVDGSADLDVGYAMVVARVETSEILR